MQHIFQLPYGYEIISEYYLEILKQRWLENPLSILITPQKLNSTKKMFSNVLSETNIFITSLDFS